MGDEVGKIGMKLQDYSIRMLIVTDQRGPKKIIIWLVHLTGFFGVGRVQV